MSKSVNKDGLGWTRRTWDAPKVKDLRWYEWGHTYRQRVYYLITRNLAVVAPAVLIFSLGYKFLPYSKDTLAQGGRRMTFIDESESAVARRYKTNDTALSQQVSVAKSDEQSFRTKIDRFVMDVADTVLGSDRKAPESELYSKLESEVENDSKT